MLCLWTTRPRVLGLVPFAIGATAAFLSPTPDLLVTGDGRHVAVVAIDGRPMMLRDRSGDFMRDLISEASGFDEEPGLLDAAPFGSCSRDSCIAVIQREGREYRLIATRSTTRIDWPGARPGLRAGRHCRVRPLVAQKLHAPLAQARPQGARADRRGSALPGSQAASGNGVRTYRRASVGNVTGSGKSAMAELLTTGRIPCRNM